jgi:hypothetical protein
MADLIRIWLETSHHPAFRCGGWAFVRRDASGLSGAAGGDRHVTLEHATLTALAEALKGAPSDAEVAVLTGNRQILALPARIAGFAQSDPPSEDLDLWAQISTALKSVRISPAPTNAFAAAWAELARDKAKASGGFRAPIPKPNLAKAGV